MVDICHFACYLPYNICLIAGYLLCTSPYISSTNNIPETAPDKFILFEPFLSHTVFLGGFTGNEAPTISNIQHIIPLNFHHRTGAELSVALLLNNYTMANIDSITVTHIQSTIVNFS